MNHTTLCVGLDVHKDSTAVTLAVAVAVSEPGAKACFLGTLSPELEELRKVLGNLGEPGNLKAVYKARALLSHHGKTGTHPASLGA